MSLTIELPKELESELAAEAAELGLPLSEYALRLLSTRLPALTEPKNGADLVTYWENEQLIGTRQDLADSQAEARKLRKEAEKRKHE